MDEMGYDMGYTIGTIFDLTGENEESFETAFRTLCWELQFTEI